MKIRTYTLIAVLLVCIFPSLSNSQEETPSLNEIFRKLPDYRYFIMQFYDFPYIEKQGKWQKEVFLSYVKKNEKGIISELVEDADWMLEIRIAKTMIRKKAKEKLDAIQPDDYDEMKRVKKEVGGAIGWSIIDSIVISGPSAGTNFRAYLQKNKSKPIGNVYEQPLYLFKDKVPGVKGAVADMYCAFLPGENEVVMSNRKSFVKEYVGVSKGGELSAFENPYNESFLELGKYVKGCWELIMPDDRDRAIKLQAKAYNYPEEEVQERLLTYKKYAIGRYQIRFTESGEYKEKVIYLYGEEADNERLRGRLQSWVESGIYQRKRVSLEGKDPSLIFSGKIEGQTIIIDTICKSEREAYDFGFLEQPAKKTTEKEK